jgi:hypothetical protein
MHHFYEVLAVGKTSFRKTFFSMINNKTARLVKMLWLQPAEIDALATVVHRGDRPAAAIDLLARHERRRLARMAALRAALTL